MPTNVPDESLPGKTLISLLWLLCGVFSWYVGLVLSTSVVSPFLARWIIIPGGIPFSQVILGVAEILFFRAGDYITAFLATAVLCSLTGYRRWRLLGFVVGANGYPLYVDVAQLFVYLDSYPKVPSWVLGWSLRAMGPTVIVPPLAAWLGCIVGRKLRLRRTASSALG